VLFGPFGQALHRGPIRRAIDDKPRAMTAGIWQECGRCRPPLMSRAKKVEPWPGETPGRPNQTPVYPSSEGGNQTDAPLVRRPQDGAYGIFACPGI